jgi:RNA polymerase primary sigma factor
MDYDGLSSYIAKLPCQRLGKEEELHLIRTAKSNGPEALAAQKTVIEAHLRMVVNIARDHQHLGIDLEDLIAVGNMGLLHALERFKPDMQCRLATYAVWWIRESIKQSLSWEARTIRVPKKTLRKIHKLKRIIRDMTENLGHEPTTGEVADETNLPPARIEKILQLEPQSVPLDWKAKPDGEPLSNTLPDERVKNPGTAAGERADHAWITNLLGSLPPHEQQIIRWRFGWGGKPKTLGEIGKIKNLSRERIRQIENACLQKLRLRAKAAQWGT